MNSIDQKAINIILYEHWCENLNIGHMDFFLLFFCLVSLVYYTWIQNFHVSIFFPISFFPIQKLRTCDSKTKIQYMYFFSFPCQNQDLREISEKYGELAYNILKPTEINVCVHWKHCSMVNPWDIEPINILNPFGSGIHSVVSIQLNSLLDFHNIRVLWV